MSVQPSTSYLAAHRHDHDRVEIDSRTNSSRSRSSAATRPSSATSGATSCSPPTSCRSSGGRPARGAPPRGGSPSSSRPGCSSASAPSPAAAATRGSTSSAPKGTGCSRRRADSGPQRYERRDVYDYTYVLHDLHVNSWVLAYRRALDGALLDWEGETAFEPPPARAEHPVAPRR